MAVLTTMLRNFLQTSYRLASHQTSFPQQLRTLTCASVPPPPSDNTPASPQDPTSAPPPTPPSDEDLDGGRVLARLSKMTLALKDAIETEKIVEAQFPELIIQTDEEVKAALDLVRNALDRAGRPCTVEELSDRISHNVVPIPPSALDYQQYLDATNFRDEFEEKLVHLNVFPPRDALMEGSGVPFSRKERQKVRRQREREAAGLPPLPEDDESSKNGSSEKSMLELPELRPVTEDELERRKDFLEKSTSMNYILRGYDTALLEVGRVHKVVKGGTKMSMRALVVIGNRKGVAGYGEGKSDTVQHAIERACRDAKRNILDLDLYQGRTIHHRVKGKFVKSRVSLWPSPRGWGVSANNNFSAIFQLFGVKDVGAKLHGPRCLANAVKALFNALSNLETPQALSARRGIDKLPHYPSLEEVGIRRRKIRSF